MHYALLYYHFSSQLSSPLVFMHVTWKQVSQEMAMNVVLIKDLTTVAHGKALYSSQFGVSS